MSHIKNFQSFQINENYIYNEEKLYAKKYIVDLLSKAPKYMKSEIKNLPSIKGKDKQGNEVIYTTISQRVWQYLFGKF
jgi:hypothetical protein